MTEQHEWAITMAGTVVCVITGDKITNKEANRRLNEYETLKKKCDALEEWKHYAFKADPNIDLGIARERKTDADTLEGK